MGLLNWAKYTKIILDAENEFENIYNFEVPPEKKTTKNVFVIAYYVLFENFRRNKILPANIEELISALREKSPFYKYFIPNGYQNGNYLLLKFIYQTYIDNRARGFTSEESIILSLNESENFLMECEEKYDLINKKKPEEIFYELTLEDKKIIEYNGFTFIGNDVVRQNNTWQDYTVKKKGNKIIFLNGKIIEDKITIDLSNNLDSYMNNQSSDKTENKPRIIDDTTAEVNKMLKKNSNPSILIICLIIFLLSILLLSIPK